MGLRDELQADLGEAFDDVDGLADVMEPFEAVRTVSSGQYDPVTGTYPVATETWQGRWVRDEWTRQELDSAQIQATDVKRVVLQNETEWRPAVDDVVNGFRVVDFSQDGALATWELQLRRS